MSLAGAKAAARKAALARRRAAHEPARSMRAAAYLLEFLSPHRGKVLAGYMPVLSEIDPLPVMAGWAAYGQVGVPVVQGAGQALKFREWTADCALEEGPFGVKVPVSGDWLVPEVVIVPLLAFERKGGRLGYGGGFYDRTLAGLRAARPTLAVGFAYAAQQDDNLPLEACDQPLDALVSERGVLEF